MNLIYKDIDIVKSEAQIILHSCNCQHIMGGLAGYLKKVYPEIYQADLKTQRGDITKLGTILVVPIISEHQSGDFKPEFVINCYTQFDIDSRNRQTNYESFYRCMEGVRSFCIDNCIKSIAIPYGIGCGLGGADYRIIRMMIEVVFEDVNIDIMICKYEP